MNLNALPLKATFTPATAPGPQNDSCLLIVLHGRGDSPAGFSFLPEALAIPELDYLMLQAPEPYYDGYSWYDHPPNQLPGITRSRVLLEETLTAVWRQGYAPERTLLFGFSQGCLMTLEFGSRYAHRLAGYVGISGYAYDVDAIVREAVPENRAGPWLITHGTRDDVLPVDRSRAQMEQLQAAGFALEYREYAKSHTIDDLDEIPFLRKWIASRIESVR
jgi:phospholipase/carboxylesterase